MWPDSYHYHYYYPCGAVGRNAHLVLWRLDCYRWLPSRHRRLGPQHHPYCDGSLCSSTLYACRLGLQQHVDAFRRAGATPAGLVAPAG